MSDSRLVYEVLSMLAADDESPWILHHSLIHDPEYADLDVSRLLTTLDELERRGWATPWMVLHDDPDDPNKHGPPTADYKNEALAAYQDLVLRKQHRRYMLQEYGPWYTITDRGHTERERLAPRYDQQPN
jgi:hypothetical protein